MSIYESEDFTIVLDYVLGSKEKAREIKADLDLALRIRLERKVRQKLSEKGKIHAKG